MVIKNRRVTAAEEAKQVEIAEEASDLLFEAEDVAELMAEVTGQVVEVSVEDDNVIFTVGDDEYTVSAEDDIETVESSTRVRGRNSVKASRNVRRNIPVTSSRTVRKIRK